MFDRESLLCTRVLRGHIGSVLCLQYDGAHVISGSSDASVRVWSLSTGRCLQTLRQQREAVLHLRFTPYMMVTCSKDRSIVVWDCVPAVEPAQGEQLAHAAASPVALPDAMRGVCGSPITFQVRHVITGHRAAVNVVDFDSK